MGRGSQIANAVKAVAQRLKFEGVREAWRAHGHERDDRRSFLRWSIGAAVATPMGIYALLVLLFATSPSDAMYGAIERGQLFISAIGILTLSGRTLFAVHPKDDRADKAAFYAQTLMVAAIALWVATTINALDVLPSANAGGAQDFARDALPWVGVFWIAISTVFGFFVIALKHRTVESVSSR